MNAENGLASWSIKACFGNESGLPSRSKPLPRVLGKNRYLVTGVSEPTLMINKGPFRTPTVVVELVCE
jgi:hypothetical protein